MKNLLKIKKLSFFKSIKGKFLLLMGTLIVLSLVTSSLLTYTSVKSKQFQQILDIFKSDVNGISSTVEYFIKSESLELNGFLYDNKFTNFAKADVSKLKKNDKNLIKEQKKLNSIFKKDTEVSYVSNVYLINKDGIIVSAANEDALLVDVSDREYFKKIKNGDDTYISDIITSSDKNVGSINVIARRMTDENGNFIGMIGKDLLSTAYVDLLKSYNIGRYNVFLQDKSGKFIYNVDDSLIGTVQSLDVQGTSDLGDGIHEVSYKYKGSDKLALTKPIDTLGWTIYSTGHVEDINAPIRKILQNSMFIAFFIVVLSLLATLVLAKKFTDPIKKLKTYTNRISKGDLSFRISDINTGDEIEDLSKELNIALDSLSETLTDVKSTVDVVNDQSSNLSAINEEVSATNSEIALAISNISERICDSALQAQNCEKQTKDLEQSLNSLDSHNKIMTTQSDSVVSSLNKNSTNLNNLLGSKVESTKSFNDLKETIDKLILGVKNISDFLNVINQIAEQTNLLSLNAAIEAARAGEAGKGFAVVSDEIRNLSSDTQNATENIKGIINQINTLVNNTKDTLDSTEKLNVNENEYFKLMEISFSDMQLSLEEMVSITNKISSEISSINTKKNEVLLSISEVSDSSQQIAAITEEVNASANEQSSTFETINQSAQELQFTAEDVREKVEQFKLN